jgi:hypothetical protein
MRVNKLEVGDGSLYGYRFRRFVVCCPVVCVRHAGQRHKAHKQGKKSHTLVLQAEPPKCNLQILTINLPENSPSVTDNMTNWKRKKLQESIRLDTL